MAGLDFDALFDSLDMGLGKAAMSPTDSIGMPSPTMAETRPSDQAMSVDGSESDRGSSGSSDAGDATESIPHEEVQRVRGTKAYSLRQSSIINHIQTERRQKQPKQPKPKVKPAPLSKYRRRTANARERGRMKEINDGFETLRLAIPNYPTSTDKGSKLTKITTLRLAMNYISALREMLDNSEAITPEPCPTPTPAPVPQQSSQPGALSPPDAGMELNTYSNINICATLTDFPAQDPGVFSLPGLPCQMAPQQKFLPS